MNIGTYLHFYIGGLAYDLLSEREVIIVGVNRKVFVISMNDESNRYDLEFSEVKPVLRRLSAITEKEACEIIRLERADKFKNVEVVDGQIIYKDMAPAYKTGKIKKHSLNHFNADQILFLIENSFDLFDLIDKDLAIDKSELDKINEALKQKEEDDYFRLRYEYLSRANKELNK